MSCSMTAHDAQAIGSGCCTRSRAAARSPTTGVQTPLRRRPRNSTAQSRRRAHAPGNRQTSRYRIPYTTSWCVSHNAVLVEQPTMKQIITSRVRVANACAGGNPLCSSHGFEAHLALGCAAGLQSRCMHDPGAIVARVSTRSIAGIAVVGRHEAARWSSVKSNPSCTAHSYCSTCRSRTIAGVLLSRGACRAVHAAAGREGLGHVGHVQSAVLQPVSHAALGAAAGASAGSGADPCAAYQSGADRESDQLAGARVYSTCPALLPRQRAMDSSDARSSESCRPKRTTTVLMHAAHPDASRTRMLVSVWVYTCS